MCLTKKKKIATKYQNKTNRKHKENKQKILFSSWSHGSFLSLALKGSVYFLFFFVIWSTVKAAALIPNKQKRQSIHLLCLKENLGPGCWLPISLFWKKEWFILASVTDTCLRWPQGAISLSKVCEIPSWKKREAKPGFLWVWDGIKAQDCGVHHAGVMQEGVETPGHATQEKQNQ